jgi:hypothetical protein
LAVCTYLELDLLLAEIVVFMIEVKFSRENVQVL